MAGDDLPVIDIGPWLRGEAAGRKVVADVEAACVNTGFFIVVGHGVPRQTTANIYNLARDFFDLAEEEKRKLVGAPQSLGGVGFAPLGDEALAATKGLKTPGDIKESLNFGPLLPGSPWPPRPDGLRAAFGAYFGAMETLARSLRGIFCAAIGLPADHFEKDFVDHTSALRVINYPAQADAPLSGQLRAGVHTDYGFMTILRSEASSGGLQVQRRDGEWINAPAIDEAYVVNIADAFMRWTNDAWTSTPHRVMNPPRDAGPSARRQSIPYFVNPARDAMIACLPQFAKGGEKYPPISFGDYIAIKTGQAFAKPPA